MNLKTRTTMNAIKYLLLHNLHDCTSSSFKVPLQLLNKNNIGRLMEKKRQVLKPFYQFSILYLRYCMFKRTERVLTDALGTD